jgi:DUF1680 family protein
VGTAFESNAKFGESVYFHDDNGVYVNLFIPSVLTWKEKGMKLLQETSYPESDKTSITIQTPASAAMSLFIRYPSWATSGAVVTINGKKVPVNQKPGSYIVLNRKWNAGDKIEVRLPMTLRYIPAPDDPQVTAIAYGPVLLAGVMGTEGLTDVNSLCKDQNELNKFFIPANLIHELNTKGAKRF